MVCDLGRVAYEPVWRWQQRYSADRVRRRRQDGDAGVDVADGVAHPDTLLLLEHDPVYTLGRGASEDHFHGLAVDKGGFAVVRVERGGEITYHGPGQLVAYPLLDLRFHRKDLRWYVTSIEDVVIRTLAAFGVEAHREPGLPGVWVDGAKIAALGIAASSWCTMHGFSLNVDPCMDDFKHIVPCGIQDRDVTSLRVLLQDDCPSMDAVKAQVRAAFQDVFAVTLQPAQLAIE